jgi:hypothetical protein
MAKDPAFLFYPGDWQGGTMIFSRFLKGCYMDILIAQFNNGHLSLEEIKTVLGSDFGQAWPTLQKKFKTDTNGLFFNEKLETEMMKRREYSISRSNNRKKKDTNNISSTHEQSYVNHMEDGDENDNELKEKSVKQLPRGTGELIPLPFNSDAFTFAWNEWNDYRREIRKKLTPATAKKQLKKLAGYPEQVAIEMITQSIEKGWQGLFEIESQAIRTVNGKGKHDRNEFNQNELEIIRQHINSSGQ